MNSTPRIAFAGTPDFAACALDAILAAGYPVPLVLTQPDRPSGRGMKLAHSSVKQLALAHGLTVDQPERLRTDAQRLKLEESRPDVLVVAAYGLILPPEVLALPRWGCLNIHASLLPRWRGAAPIQRAIEAGDAQTGITIMQMDKGLDTGPMCLCRSLDIASDDTAGRLHDKLSKLGAEMIVEALARLESGNLPVTPQPAEGISYAHKITRAEGNLNWSRTAEELERQIRAFDPYPTTFSQIRGTTLKIRATHRIAAHGTPGTLLDVSASGIVVACGKEALCVKELQRPGSRWMAAAEFLRGFALAAGDCFDLP